MAPFALRLLPASAAEGCNGGDIVALADYVLSNRSKLPKLQSRRNGAISAYLKIHYHAPSAEQVEAMIGPLVTARVERADELLASWRISANGLEATLAAAPELEATILSAGAGGSALRAAVLAGDAPTLFDKMAALADVVRSALQMALVEALVDLDDASAQALVTEASTRNLQIVAGGLIATHGDAAAWTEFSAGVADPVLARTLTEKLAWLPALRGKPPLPRPPAQDAQGEIARTLIHSATIAAARTPERDFLLTYFNQSGDYAGTSAAAAMINDLTRDGASIDMETAWLVVAESLKSAAGNPQAVSAQLKAIPVRGLRFAGDNVQAVIDAMLAVEAFKGAASGTGRAPALVAGVSEDFVVQLPAWREAAEAIGKGGDLSAFRSSGQRLAIVADLLFAVGRHGELAKFLVSTVPNSDSIRLAECFAEALDRRCAGHLAFPGEALTMPGTPLFRFDPGT